MDYAETFFPVAKISFVKVIISPATNFKWSLFQLDVKNAFLYEDLTKEIYIGQPPRIVA